LVPLAE